MAANHDEFLKALKESTHHVSVLACRRWMDAKTTHPLYHQLSDTRTTPHDKELLTIIHRDIESLRIEFLDTLKLRTLAWDDYYDFI